MVASCWVLSDLHVALFCHLPNQLRQPTGVELISAYLSCASLREILSGRAIRDQYQARSVTEDLTSRDCQSTQRQLGRGSTMLMRGGLVLALALLVVQAECSHWAAQRSILQTNNNNNNNGGWFLYFPKRWVACAVPNVSSSGLRGGKCANIHTEPFVFILTLGR